MPVSEGAKTKMITMLYSDWSPMTLGGRTRSSVSSLLTEDKNASAMLGKTDGRRPIGKFRKAAEI